MSYCSLCKKIIDIRKEQGQDYYQDLCDKCKLIYLNQEKQVKKLMVN